eukprot:8412453-Pyramimonas_sp.AAC.1
MALTVLVGCFTDNQSFSPLLCVSCADPTYQSPDARQCDCQRTEAPRGSDTWRRDCQRIEAPFRGLGAEGRAALPGRRPRVLPRGCCAG